MGCHDLHASEVYWIAGSGMKKAAGCSFSLSRSCKALPYCTAAGPLPASPASGRGEFVYRPVSPRLSASVSRMSFLHPVSFLFLPFSPPPACLCGGTLFRAYPARAQARVGAGAVHAPDCPGAPARASRTQDAPVPSASQGFFRAGANAKGQAAPDAASGPSI